MKENQTKATGGHKLPLKEKLAFTSGVIAGQSSVAILNQMLVPIYQITLGLNPMLVAPTGAVSSFMVNAMMADVAFYDQWRTGQRREAMFTATAGWLYKLSFSLSGVLSGMVLVATGFDVNLGGNQTEFTKRWLIIGMVLGSCLPAVITAGALLFYKLSPQFMERCRLEIAQRNAAATPSEK